MWGTSIVGFGTQAYTNSTGTNDWFVVGFSPPSVRHHDLRRARRLRASGPPARSARAAQHRQGLPVHQTTERRRRRRADRNDPYRLGTGTAGRPRRLARHPRDRRSCDAQDHPPVGQRVHGAGVYRRPRRIGRIGARRHPPSPGDLPRLPDGWVADEVTVPTDLGTIWGTWTHPRTSPPVPAALIIGGSGADRSRRQLGRRPAGESTTWSRGRLARCRRRRHAADRQARIGQDRPRQHHGGDGRGGHGRRLPDDERRAADVRRRPARRRRRPDLAVVGHSEGGLFALLLGAGRHGARRAFRPFRRSPGWSRNPADPRPPQGPGDRPGPEAETSGTVGAEQASRCSTGSPPRSPRCAPARRSRRPASELAGLFPSTVLTYLRTDDALDPRSVAPRCRPGCPSCCRAPTPTSRSPAPTSSNSPPPPPAPGPT